VLYATKTSCFVRFFYENRKLNLDLKSTFSGIGSLQSMYDDILCMMI
jgi:hypothetical protein